MLEQLHEEYSFWGQTIKRKKEEYDDLDLNILSTEKLKDLKTFMGLGSCEVWSYEVEVWKKKQLEQKTNECTPKWATGGSNANWYMEVNITNKDTIECKELKWHENEVMMIQKYMKRDNLYKKENKEARSGRKINDEWQTLIVSFEKININPNSFKSFYSSKDILVYCIKWFVRFTM